MCGICGFTGKKDEAVLIKMTDTIRHRGPDEDGFYASYGANMGIRRLSIVDLTTGQQPICNEDQTIWVVFNGEIYNHLELREQLKLKGHIFKTDHSDTEVIVHLYEEYGEDWPVHINGMFGVALWDQQNEKLFLYRDRIGKKPLYYALNNGQLVFGSEIKAVRKHPDVSSDLDYQALYHYFGLKNISAPRTAFAQIKQLLPGHVLIWQAGNIKTRPYWKVNFADCLSDITEEEASNHLFELFEDAVKIRMQCDVPFGAYLSGGVDSSAVVAMMCRYHSKPVKTFCLGYEDEPDGQFAGKAQDILYARKMSEILGTEHYEYIINAEEFARQMPDVLAAFDEPFSGTISTFFLSILIHKHVKVTLSGDGADELFGSYLAHRLALPLEHYLDIKNRGVNDWCDLSDNDKEALGPFDTPEQFRFLQSIASSSIATWRNRLCVFDDAERFQLLSEDFLHSTDYPNAENIYKMMESNLTARDTLNKSLEIDQRELLPSQVLPFVDRLSMSHSIEVRCPYLDYRIIEFSNRLPGKLKIKNGIVKHVHKMAMKKLLPEDLLQRPKEGFVQPVYSWMHGSLKGWTERNLDSLSEDIFNLDYVKNLKKAFQSGEHSLDARIWNLICFNIWFNQLV
ncbi:MAG: asparagine synthase (glutamine-hydrolyzing) [Desulfobacteraceae bacterium]|nr:asparagine synthase (glutamine-hydrolyzing) [Desulfobacteraceae bacterium]